VSVSHIYIAETLEPTFARGKSVIEGNGVDVAVVRFGGKFEPSGRALSLVLIASAISWRLGWPNIPGLPFAPLGIALSQDLVPRRRRSPEPVA
jgi:hypothetical protein